MSANDGTGNIPERDEWETEQELWNTLHTQYNFELDCCASETNRKVQYWAKNIEWLNPTEQTVWMNPPFSKAKLMFIHFFKIVKSGVAIYRCDNMETKVWQEIILKNADWIFIPKGRISYTPFETGNMRGGKGTRFPSALIGIGLEPPKNLKGTTLFPEDAVRSAVELLRKDYEAFAVWCQEHCKDGMVNIIPMQFIIETHLRIEKAFPVFYEEKEAAR